MTKLTAIIVAAFSLLLTRECVNLALQYCWTPKEVCAESTVVPSTCVMYISYGSGIMMPFYYSCEEQRCVRYEHNPAWDSDPKCGGKR